MKKVLFLNLTAFSQTGGIERFNRCFLKALCEFDNEGLTTSSAYSAYDVQPSELYYNEASYRGFNKNKLRFVWQSILAARNKDIVIIGHINLAPVALMIKKIFPAKKMILITHGIDVWGELSKIKQKLLTETDRILSVSSFTKGKLVDRHNVPADKVTVFHNTIDPYFPIPDAVTKSESLRSRYGLSENDFVLYTLTRLSSTELYKGYDNVIQAVGEIAQANKAIKYVIAGKYDKQEKSRIDKLIADNGLTDHVILAGFLDEQELVAHYQMADMYIMPSKKEGFGIVFIEALVCGVPVVAGNADGSVDALMNGELGTLVNPDSINEIQNAILDQMKAGPATESEQISIRKKTLDNFSFSSYKKRLRAIIAEC